MRPAETILVMEGGGIQEKYGGGGFNSDIL
jgi:hypothetical protein